MRKWPATFVPRRPSDSVKSLYFDDVPPVYSSVIPLFNPLPTQNPEGAGGAGNVQAHEGEEAEAAVADLVVVRAQ